MISDKQDLDWLAFCYAAGELTPVEAEQFELRLVDDQSIREALARAVELGQTVAAAEGGAVFCKSNHDSVNSEKVLLASRAGKTWHNRFAWMAIGGLASLLLALLWSDVIGPSLQTANRNYRVFSQRNLAFAWTETRSQLADVREAGYWPTTFSMDSDDEAATIGLFDDTMPDAPSWMTAAVFSTSNNNSTNNSVDVPGEPRRLEN